MSQFIVRALRAFRLPPTSVCCSKVGTLVASGLLAGTTLSSCDKSSERDTSAAPTAVRPTAPKANSASVAPPPPPPPPEAKSPSSVPKAKATETKTPPSKVARKAVKKACEAECGGEVTVALQRTLRAKAGQARSCYNRALSNNDSELSGSLTVNVRVGPKGEACRVSIGSDTLGDSDVSRCVAQRFRSGDFPLPNGGCVDVAVPINFVSQ